MTRRPKRMSPALVAGVAEQFKALAEPSRLLLMNVLFGGPRSVGELVAESGLSQANVSKHLAVLHRAGWLRREKSGAGVVYELADRRAHELCDIMCERVRQQAAATAADLRR